MSLLITITKHYPLTIKLIREMKMLNQNNKPYFGFMVKLKGYERQLMLNIAYKIAKFKNC